MKHLSESQPDFTYIYLVVGRTAYEIDTQILVATETEKLKDFNMQTLPSHEIVKIPNLCILQPVI